MNKVIQFASVTQIPDLVKNWMPRLEMSEEKIWQIRHFFPTKCSSMESEHPLFNISISLTFIYLWAVSISQAQLICLLKKEEINCSFTVKDFCDKDFVVRLARPISISPYQQSVKSQKTRQITAHDQIVKINLFPFDNFIATTKMKYQ